MWSHLCPLQTPDFWTCDPWAYDFKCPWDVKTWMFQATMGWFASGAKAKRVCLCVCACSPKCSAPIDLSAMSKVNARFRRRLRCPNKWMGPISSRAWVEEVSNARTLSHHAISPRVSVLQMRQWDQQPIHKGKELTLCSRCEILWSPLSEMDPCWWRVSLNGYWSRVLIKSNKISSTVEKSWNFD